MSSYVCHWSMPVVVMCSYILLSIDIEIILCCDNGQAMVYNDFGFPVPIESRRVNKKQITFSRVPSVFNLQSKIDWTR